MNKKYAIIIVIVVIILTAVFFIWQKYYKNQAPSQLLPATKEEPQTLGSKISEQIENPAEKLPQTNPYQTQTNPFEEAETNPFKEIYKNPFAQ